MTQIVEPSVETALRARVRAWLEEHWDPSMDPAEWRRKVVDSGWAFCTFPEEWYGLGIAPEHAYVVEAEFERIGALSPSFGPGLHHMTFVMGPTLLAHGSDELKRSLLGPLLRGDLGNGCLLYSEPGAGSDLASLQTRADHEGDGYRINGQKVWTSDAEEADWGVLLARTNWDVPKHRGISLFLFPIKVDGVRQEGVEIRPILEITGDSHFNEVFLNDAQVPATHLVGFEDDGWRVLQTALFNERLMMSRMHRGEEEDHDAPILNGAAEFVAASRAAGRTDDPLVRQAIAQIHTWRLVQVWNTHRAANDLRAGSSSSLASLGKLANSRVLHHTGTLLRTLAGPEAFLYDYDDFDRGSANFRAMNAFINSIGGGTDQVQRNIIGERILGLPKGIDPDRDVAFREARKAVATPKLSQRDHT